MEQILSVMWHNTAATAPVEIMLDVAVVATAAAAPQ